jgi:L-alanine-DL-glutamate epimerase-like enolase superfamily enzyme
MDIEIGSYPTTFKVAVRHASAVRKVTDNVICRVTDDAGIVGIGEGCPRSYVTGETSDTARRFLLGVSPAVAACVDRDGLDGLRAWMDEHRADVDENPAAFCALEIAMLDLLARRAGVTIERLLAQEPLGGRFRYTAVLGDNPRLLYAILLQRYLFRGFRDFKIKLSGDLRRDRSKLGRLRRKDDAVRVRVDANNLWDSPGRCIDHVRALDFRFFGIEEPLAAHDLAGFAEIATAVQTPIILDESGLRREQLAELPGDAAMWMLNCRVSKMGGIQRSLETVQAARALGIGVIVGAQVGETSILTRAALTVAAAAGDELLGQEGAFGTHLLREDLTEPVVMFDRRGVVDAATLAHHAPGLGLTVARPLSSIERPEAPPFL